MSVASPLQVAHEGGVVTLTFNRPGALNALDLSLAMALHRTFSAIATDKSVRAVVLRGAGRAFMAGGDLHMLRADPLGSVASTLKYLNGMVELLASLDAPVIAQVHGAAAGAGLSFMLLADFVLAEEGTRLNMAYVKLGKSCDVGASWILPRLVGLRRALEISLLGDDVPLAEAQRLGLVNRVLPSGELDVAVDELAKRIAKGPTAALGQMRRLMRSSLDRSLTEQLAAETRALCACARTEDFPKGIEAFFEKREPQFEGR